MKEGPKKIEQTSVDNSFKDFLIERLLVKFGL